MLKELSTVQKSPALRTGISAEYQQAINHDLPMVIGFS